MIGSLLRLRLLWLTLFAFGAQIVVADFHHHITRGTGMEARAMTAGMCRPSQGAPCPPMHGDHDGCVLCWAAAIAATSLTPVTFYLPLPSGIVGVRLSVSDSHQTLGSRLTDVRARGPPVAILG